MKESGLPNLNEAVQIQVKDWCSSLFTLGVENCPPYEAFAIPYQIEFSFPEIVRPIRKRLTR